MSGFLSSLFEKFRRPSAHPHQRELRALIACRIAFRRSMFEHWFREKEADEKTLEEKRDALAWYVKGAGGTDPFSSHVLAVPIGKLDPGLFLLAHYRIETAISIAWALGLVDAIPPVDERASLELLDRLLPLRGTPRIRDATLRDRAQLERARSRVACTHSRSESTPQRGVGCERAVLSRIRTRAGPRVCLRRCRLPRRCRDRFLTREHRLHAARLPRRRPCARRRVPRKTEAATPLGPQDPHPPAEA